MKKRLLSLALTLVMACGLLPRLALAADVTVTEVVPCQYAFAEDFHEGLAAVCVVEYPDTTSILYRWGFIDKTGKEVAPCKYENFDAPEFHEGFAAVRLNDKWGFIDKTGKEVVPCKYSEVEDVSEGLAAVKLDDKWGFIDTTGKEVVPIGKYDGVENFSEGLAAVKGESGEKDRWGYPVYKWGFIDKTGREIVPCKYGAVGYDSFSKGLAAVALDGKWGFIDTTGKEVVPCKYDRVGDFSDGLAAVKLNDKWGYIDKTGKEVVPCTLEYYEVENFSEGLAAVQLKDKWGFIDKTGKEVVPCKYDYVQTFSEGLAVVNIGYEYGYGGKYGYINATGQEVVPRKYNWAGSFSEGLAVVELATDEKDERGDTIYKWGFIDTTGKEVVPCTLEYYEVKNFSEGLAAVSDTHVEFGNGGRFGFISVNGAATQPTATTAYASTQTVTVDGKPVTFYAYALKDANGNDTNYIKLRDVAQILNGSAAQFQVGYDGSITITTKTAYTPNGSEMVQNFTGNQSYTVSTSPVTVNGQPTNLEAITLTDASGGGYTYFKLRDLGAALGFNVSWSADTGISIDPNSPYNANN